MHTILKRPFSAILQLTFLFLALLVVQGEAFASSSDEDMLSLNQAVTIALKTNPGLKQKVTLVESAEMTALQRQADFYPNLELSASGSQHFDQALNQGTGQAEDRNFETLSAALSSSINLFNGFGDVAALKGAELELGAVRETLSREEQTLIFETITSFIRVLTNQALIHVEEKNLEENSKLLESIETLYQAGRLAISDLYQQQAETKQAELDLLEAKRTLNVSKLVLMQTMGLAPTIRYQVATPDFEKLSLPLTDEDLDQLSLRSLANRADVKSQQRQIEAAGQKIRQSQAGHLPKVDLFASLASDYSSLADDNHFSDQFMEDNFNSTVGISFSIPLFDRFLTRNEIAKAKIEKRNEQLTLRQKQLQIGLEIAQAIQEYRATQKRVDVVESKLIPARQSLHSYEERYRVGASTLVELTQSRTQYVSAVFGQIQARYDLVNQEIAVAYYLGNLDSLLAALELEKN